VLTLFATALHKWQEALSAGDNPGNPDSILYSSTSKLV
jgi:hypothetical protein